MSNEFAWKPYRLNKCHFLLVEVSISNFIWLLKIFDYMSKYLCSFSIVAMANYHKFNGLRQHKRIILKFHRSSVQHWSHWTQIEVSAEWFLFEGSQRGSVFCLFQLLKAACFLWLISSFSIIKPNSTRLSSFNAVIAFLLIFCICLSHTKTLQIILDPST